MTLEETENVELTVDVNVSERVVVAVRLGEPLRDPDAATVAVPDKLGAEEGDPVRLAAAEIDADSDREGLTEEESEEDEEAATVPVRVEVLEEVLLAEGLPDDDTVVMPLSEAVEAMEFDPVQVALAVPASVGDQLALSVCVVATLALRVRVEEKLSLSVPLTVREPLCDCVELELALCDPEKVGEALDDSEELELALCDPEEVGEPLDDSEELELALKDPEKVVVLLLDEEMVREKDSEGDAAEERLAVPEPVRERLGE